MVTSTTTTLSTLTPSAWSNATMIATEHAMVELDIFTEFMLFIGSFLASIPFILLISLTMASLYHNTSFDLAKKFAPRTWTTPPKSKVLVAICVLGAFHRFLVFVLAGFRAYIEGWAGSYEVPMYSAVLVMAITGFFLSEFAVVWLIMASLMKLGLVSRTDEGEERHDQEVLPRYEQLQGRYHAVQTEENELEEGVSERREMMFDVAEHGASSPAAAAIPSSSKATVKDAKGATDSVKDEFTADSSSDDKTSPWSDVGGDDLSDPGHDC